MKSFRDESGQTLVLTALCMTILIGCMALALDVSLLFRAKRKVQIAADAAAIAGALEYNYHGTTNMVSVAKTAASNNGITDTNQVAVHNPPWSGYHTGSGYIEVVVDQPNPTVFMNMFGRSSVNVASRAVAGVVDAPTCMYVLNPHGADTFHTQGNSSITAPKCGITVDSDNANAYCDTGGSSTINAPYFRVVGGQNPKGNCKGTPERSHHAGRVCSCGRSIQQHVRTESSDGLQCWQYHSANVYHTHIASAASEWRCCLLYLQCHIEQLNAGIECLPF